MDLAVHESGNPDGPTVLLVHGWPDTHHLWNGVAEELGVDFRVVSYDTRGQGESSDPGSVEAFALEELAADVLAVADAVSPDTPVQRWWVSGQPCARSTVGPSGLPLSWTARSTEPLRTRRRVEEVTFPS